jgi:hypothetical protein
MLRKPHQHYRNLTQYTSAWNKVWQPPTVNIGALKRAVIHQMWKPLTTNTLALKRAVCLSAVTATPMQALANQRSEWEATTPIG